MFAAIKRLFRLKLPLRFLLWLAVVTLFVTVLECCKRVYSLLRLHWRAILAISISAHEAFYIWQTGDTSRLLALVTILI